eukprot:m.169506 g.169506  ORF g.169506 m.169506 type:complete len:254 (+) comp31574_c3_seq1:65-826(+)
MSFDYGSDDDEESTIEREIPQFRVNKAKVDEVELLILAFGKIPCLCVKTRILDDTTKDWSEYGSLTTSAAPRNSLGATTSNIFSSDQQKAAICVCESTFPSGDAATWSTLLFKHLNPKKVLILVEKNKSDFNGDDLMSDKPIVRKLQSQSCIGDQPFAASTTSIKTLEAPNVLSGAAAAALTRCQAHALEGQAVVVYRETTVDMLVFDAYESVFESAASVGVSSKGKQDVADDLKARVKHLWSTNRGDSLIYL